MTSKPTTISGGCLCEGVRYTLSLYRASPGNARGFCSRCGSLLFWHQEASDRISMCVGCFDKDALRDHGRALTYAERHLFCDAEIEGVTDHLPGDRWKYDDGEGEGEAILLESRKPR